MKKWLTVVVLGMIVLSVGCMDAGRSVTEEKNIDLGDAFKIVVEASSADIEIIPENREDISVVLKTYERGPKLKVSDGKTILIEAKKDEMINISFSMNKSPKLTVYVPENYEQAVEVNNASGNIDMKAFNLSSLNIDLSSGNVNLRDMKFNEGKIENTSGNITVDTATFDTLKVTESSGELKLVDVSGAITGETTSGNVEIGYKEFAADLNYETSSGNIQVDFNKQPVDAKFDLKCTSGNVHQGFDLEKVDKEDNNEFKGKVGDGTFEVTLRATSGNITVEK